MNIRWRVELSQDEREELTALLKSGRHAVRKVKRAQIQILLAADDDVGDGEVAARVGAGGSTVYRTKRRFVEGNLELALAEAPRPGAQRKLSGKEEALLIATACSAPPAGRARWTLELLADVMVALTEHEGLSRETVRRRLAENALNPKHRGLGKRRRTFLKTTIRSDQGFAEIQPGAGVAGLPQNHPFERRHCLVITIERVIDALEKGLRVCHIGGAHASATSSRASM